MSEMNAMVADAERYLHAKDTRQLPDGASTAGALVLDTSLMDMNSSFYEVQHRIFHLYSATAFYKFFSLTFINYHLVLFYYWCPSAARLACTHSNFFSPFYFSLLIGRISLHLTVELFTFKKTL